MVPRYIDNIFFTSNESVDVINQMLDQANKFHPNIKLVRHIGTSASFLDVYIENKNGTLATSVYRKEATEPYIVPFKSDHPRHIFKNIIDTALMRAIRYSSTLSAFNEEQRSIKLMLLYNRYVSFSFQSNLRLSILQSSYPPRYIHSQFHKFYTSYLPTSFILPMITTENDFTFIRRILLDKPTIPEYQLAERIAKSINTTGSEQEVDNPLVKARLNKRSKFDTNIIIHYTFEKRLQSNNCYMQTFLMHPLSYSIIFYPSLCFSDVHDLFDHQNRTYI
jgi:hypothetical protein